MNLNGTFMLNYSEAHGWADGAAAYNVNQQVSTGAAEYKAKDLSPFIEPIFAFDFTEKNGTGTQGLVCEPAVCDETTITKMTTYADYSDCIDKKTGDKCIVKCLQSDYIKTIGYTTEAGVYTTQNELTLKCSNKDMDWTDFKEDQSIECVPNVCTTHDPAGSTVKDYSTCIGGGNALAWDSSFGELWASPDPDGFIIGCKEDGTFTENTLGAYVNALYGPGSCSDDEGATCEEGTDATMFTDSLQCAVNGCKSVSNPASSVVMYNIPKYLPDMFSDSPADATSEYEFGLRTITIKPSTTNTSVFSSNAIGRGWSAGANKDFIDESHGWFCLKNYLNDDYVAVSDSQSGDMCNPECPVFFSNSESTAGRSSEYAFEMACDSAGAFADTTPITGLLADACNPGIAAIPFRLTEESETSQLVFASTEEMAKVDYTSCIGKATGDKCTPTCAAGYFMRKLATEFTIMAVQEDYSKHT